MQQEIRFCEARDGVQIAYASVGDGPVIVKAANWLNHLDFDWESPVWRHMFRFFSRDHRLIRYDERGNGLSDWDVENFDFESMVLDLETVVDAAGVESFSLLGISQGCAVSLAYAVRHPERVERLVFCGGYARGHDRRGDPRAAEKRRKMIELIPLGWGEENPAFRQLWTSLFIPEGTAEQAEWFNELQRVCTSPQNAIALLDTFARIDVRALLPEVPVPTLVLHARGDAVVPFEEGRLLAAGLPDARLVALDSRNHLLLEHEPAWETFCREAARFLPGGRDGTAASDRRPDAGPEIGDRIGRYELISRLGAGGMGEVFRALDTNLQRHVALKLLPGAWVDDAERLARLEREARMLAGLNHPNIATVYDLERTSDSCVLAMELVEGETLARRIEAGPLAVGEALEIARQMALALQAAHRAGIVHRDLKPSNVMIDAEGRVRLLDFGIATPRRGAQVDERTSDELTSEPTRLTRTGALVGTFPYLSPEQVRGERADERSDLWAFGCVLYEMLTGAQPFARDSGATTLAAILEENPDLDRLPSSTPAPVPRLLRRCLDKDAGARPTGVERILATIEEARDEG